MLFIITAMYSEAKPIIDFLKLKKDINFNKFQVFQAEDTKLIISGTGKLNGAIALSYLLSHYKISKKDILLNIGICGSSCKGIKIGQTLLVNKIIDMDTKRSFYPDILFKHNFLEATLETHSNIVKSKDAFERTVDMEAFGIAEAGRIFFKRHQMFFIKIVSDNLDTNSITGDTVSMLVDEKISEIVFYINKIQEKFNINEEIFTKVEGELLDKIVGNLKFSQSMNIQFKQWATYYKLNKGSLEGFVKDFEELICKSKKEGKIYFEKFRKRVI